MPKFIFKRIKLEIFLRLKLRKMKAIYPYKLKLFLILSQKDKEFNRSFLTALKMNFGIIGLAIKIKT
jgi:hypothetical protein